MPRFSYGPMPIVAPDSEGGSNDLIRQDATGGVMYQTNADAVAQVNPLPIFDFAGAQISEITSGPFGQAQWIAEQDEPNGFVRFGDLIVAVDAREVGPLAQRAAAAQSAAEQALAAIRDLVASTAGLTTEGVQGVVGAMVAAAGGAYNPDTGAIAFPASSGGTVGGVDAEGVRDVIAAALTGTGLITVVANDAGDSITVQASQQLTEALAARLRIDAPQALTAAQRTQGKANLGLAGFTISAARTATDPVLTDEQARDLYGEGAFFTVDPA